MLNVDAIEAAVEGHQPTIQFNEVDPAAYASQAAALLRLSWAAPCLHYTDSYVTWQLTFPGALRSRALLATDGARAVGFVALIPRQVSTSDGVGRVYVLSFFAVHPEYRGVHIGTELARRILAIADRPTFTYVEPGSRSERALAAAAVARGWTFRQLAELRTYACPVGDRALDPPVVAREATVEDFLTAVKTPVSDTIAWSQPSVEQAMHYVADPRGSCLAIARTRDEVTLGAALIVRSQVVTARGPEDVPSLDGVYLRENHVAALGALRALAFERWPRTGQSILTAPNLQTVPTEAIRLAGFRATRSVFNVAVMGDEADPVTRHATATNLEVF